MKKKSILIILLIVAGFIEARSQWIQDPVLHKKILSGIDKLYNFEFDRADSDFTEVVRMRPDHPAGHFFKAMVLWERIISNFDDESQDDELYKVLDVVIEMCEQRLDENPDDVTALFFNGGAVGFRGRLRANRGKWIGAANDGVIAMPLVRRAHELEPNNYDVLLGIGIYNYYAAVVPDKYPFVKPVMIFFPKGDREKGLEQLRQASEKAKYARVESMYFLMQNYFVYEKDFPKALELARKLNAKYPNNSMFHRYVGRCLVSMGYISEAKAVFSEIERRCKTQQLGYDTYDAREAYYYLGKFDFMSGKFDTALQYLYLSDELSRKIDKEEPSGFMALTNLIIGNIYDMQGKRQYAEMQYKKVLDMKEYDNSHKDSEKYLAVPYTRGK